MNVEYRDSIEGVSPDDLEGFFEGWPAHPDAATHLRLLRGSAHVILAVEGSRVIGFVNAVSDGVLSAYIPLLEVLPEHRGKGIGRELLRRMLAKLDELYMVDLLCDPDMAPFYEKLGLQRFSAMGRRRYERQRGSSDRS
ncbi:MAG: GNAT family N-acetyltransferase [Acidobacteriota bacterium]